LRTIVAVLAALALLGCATAGAPPRSDERFELIRQGMTRDDALRLFGRPDETMRFSLTGNEAWDYLYVDTWGILASYSVTFGSDGRVVSKVSRRLNDGGEHGK